MEFFFLFYPKKNKFFEIIDFVILYYFFFYRYRDFKKSLKQVSGGKSTAAARQAVESLISVYLSVHILCNDCIDNFSFCFVFFLLHRVVALYSILVCYNV